MSDIASLLLNTAEYLEKLGDEWDYNENGMPFVVAKSLRDAADSMGEPVAWRAVGPSYTVVVTDPERATDSRWEPLYLAPQPAVPEGTEPVVLCVAQMRERIAQLEAKLAAVEAELVDAEKRVSLCVRRLKIEHKFSMAGDDYERAVRISQVIKKARGAK